MMLLIRELQGNTTFKVFATKAIKTGGLLLIAALVYFVIWKGFLAVFGIWTADTYNGLASVGDYSGISIGALLLFIY